MTKNQLKNKLGTSLTDFAKKHGFPLTNVTSTLNYWHNKKGCPRGRITKKIIAAFEDIIGEDFYIKD